MTRIIFAPWTAPDGQVQVSDEVVIEPDIVEVDREWVHVVTYDGSSSHRRMLRSYPALSVGQINWTDVAA